MTMIKKLPLTMAVIAAFFPLTSVMAQEFTQEQIDAIVAKAVDKALADRQAKIDAAADKKVDVITNPQTTAASPDMAIPFGLKFSGYARYGAHFQTGDQKYVGVDGSYNGASAIGRLGNESNGGEFQISKAFKSAHDNDKKASINHGGYRRVFSAYLCNGARIYSGTDRRHRRQSR